MAMVKFIEAIQTWIYIQDKVGAICVVTFILSKTWLQNQHIQLTDKAIFKVTQSWQFKVTQSKPHWFKTWI